MDGPLSTSPRTPTSIPHFAVPYIQGVQAQGTAACVKHYAANNQESNRMRNSSEVSERALREIYLPVFEAAVRDGGRVVGHGRVQRHQWSCGM